MGAAMARNTIANAAADRPIGGRTMTARRGSHPTCTAPSGRNSTGRAGSSANLTEVTVTPTAARRVQPSTDRVFYLFLRLRHQEFTREEGADLSDLPIVTADLSTTICTGGSNGE
jgi:hypothetical protein